MITSKTFEKRLKVLLMRDLTVQIVWNCSSWWLYFFVRFQVLRCHRGTDAPIREQFYKEIGLYAPQWPEVKKYLVLLKLYQHP